MSRVCEEFSLAPAAAVEAIENDVDGLVFKIIDLRSYANAKTAYENGKSETDFNKRPRGPAIDRVSEITFELAREEIERRKRLEPRD